MNIKGLLLATAAIVAVVVVIALGLLCVLCGCTAPYLDPLSSHNEYTASHAGAGNVTLDVSSGALGGGDVRIMPSLNDSIWIKVRIDGNPSTIQVKTDFSDSADGLRLSVQTISLSDELFSLRSSRSVIEVYLPPNATYDVQIKTFSGDVYVGPLQGRSLVIADPPYRQNGRITVDGGNFTLINLDTAEQMAKNHGDIRLKYNATNVYLDIGDGNVEIDTLQTEGRLKASVFSGDIRVAVPAGTGFSLDASTGKGVVNCAIPLKTEQSGEGYLKGLTIDHLSRNFTIELASGDGNIAVTTG